MPKREKPHVHYESCRGIKDPLSRPKRAACHGTVWHTTPPWRVKKNTYNHLQISQEEFFYENLAEFEQDWLSFVSAKINCYVRAEYMRLFRQPITRVIVGWVKSRETALKDVSPSSRWYLDLKRNTGAIFSAYNSSQCVWTTIRCVYLCLDHHETSPTTSVCPCNPSSWYDKKTTSHPQLRNSGWRTRWRPKGK